MKSLSSNGLFVHLCLLAQLFLGVCVVQAESAALLSTRFHLFVAPQTLRSTELSLLWDKPCDAPKDTVYEVYCDQKLVGSTKKTHFSPRGLLADHDYQFEIKAQRPLSTVQDLSETIGVRTLPAETLVSVLAHGAVGDGKTLNTQAIQAAINACPKGGVVQIPAGVFLSGALFLKSDMSLEIAEGGVLKGTANVADYEPFILNRFEGWELKTYASLINAGTLDRSGATNVRNISLRGKGTLSGGGKALGQAMKATHGLRGRGRLLCIMNAENVEIQGLRVEEAPCWTLHYIYSRNVSCHDLTIVSDVHNGDGIDPDSSANSYIFNCSFDTGDDCIAIKSGKNPEGNKVNIPTDTVRIVDCLFLRGHGISIGSEMSGGVRNVLVEDCVAGKLLNGMQIKATKDRGNVIENVIVRDCDLQKITVLTELNYNNDGEAAPEQPYFRNFQFRNIDLSKADASKPVVIIQGFPAAGHRTSRLLFKDLRLPPGARLSVDQAEDISFERVLATDGSAPSYEISRSQNIHVYQ